MTAAEIEFVDSLRNTLDHFAPITDQSFQKLLAIVRFQRVKKNEYLLRKGDIARKIYFICEGIVTSQWTDTEGHVHIKNFFLPGNFAGSTVSLLLHEPSGFSLQAIEDSIILQMDYERYKDLVYKQDDLKNFYIAYLEQKWIIENEKRQISFAAQSATDRYLAFLEDYPDVPNLVPQRLIASYLGITPTQLSRIRKEL